MSTDHTTYVDGHWKLDNWYAENKQWSFAFKMDRDDDSKDLNGSIDYTSLSDVAKHQEIIDELGYFNFVTQFFANASVGE